MIVVIRFGEAEAGGGDASAAPGCAIRPPMTPTPTVLPKPLREIIDFMVHAPSIEVHARALRAHLKFDSLYLCLPVYQMTLIPNWTSRAAVTVVFNWPAESFAEPSALKMSVWSGNTGGEKFARFKILNISARNWTLNVSDILRMWLFLNTAKSRLIRPGEVRMFLPALPRRL
jgi:hypothetical protein